MISVRKTYASQLQEMMKAINQILDDQNISKSEILTQQQRETLKNIIHDAETEVWRLNPDGETFRASFAVIGTEKSGKSTFTNALLSGRYLRSKAERCTFSATRIEYGEKDKATVYFFTEAEYYQNLGELLNQAGYTLKGDIKKLTFSQFDAWLDMQKKDGKTPSGCEEIADRLENCKTLLPLLNREPCVFEGQESVCSDECQKFIIEKTHAYAVREVVISASQLAGMKSCVLYDMPGFNSGLPMHQQQTIQRIQEADAVLLIRSAEHPSFTGDIKELLNKVCVLTGQEDGQTVSKKLFVFANRIDQVQKTEAVSKSDALEHNMQIIRNEILDSKAGWMNPEFINERLKCGSALAYLENNGIVNTSITRDSMKELGASDGIQEFRKVLSDYANEDRMPVIATRCKKLRKQLEDVLGELMSCPVPDKNSLRNEERLKCLEKIRDQLITFRNQEEGRELDMDDDIRQMLSAVIDKPYYHLDADHSEWQTICNEHQCRNQIYLVEDGEFADMLIRNKLYKKLEEELRSVVSNSSTELISECYASVRSIFCKALSIPEGTHKEEFSALEEELDVFLAPFATAIGKDDKSSADKKNVIIGSLLRVLIASPLGSLIRWERYLFDYDNCFCALVLSSPDYDNSIPNDAQSMLYEMLFQKSSATFDGTNTKKAIHQKADSLSFDDYVAYFQKLQDEAIARDIDEASGKDFATVETQFNNDVQIFKKLLLGCGLKSIGTGNNYVNAIRNPLDRLKDRIDPNDKNHEFTDLYDKHFDVIFGNEMDVLNTRRNAIMLLQNTMSPIFAMQF